MIDGKEYAKQMRENAVIDKNGNVIVSEELWQQIANIIEKQQVEIKRLESLVKTQGIEIDELNKFANERLDNFTERYDRNLKAEAIKEFAKRLSEYIEYRYNENCDFVPYVRLSDIEKVEKEMVGAENE